jgi:hypothetical protein
MRLGDVVSRVLYLGASDGAAVVYDICTHRVVSRTQLTFASNELHCPAPDTMKPNGSPRSAG